MEAAEEAKNEWELGYDFGLREGRKEGEREADKAWGNGLTPGLRKSRQEREQEMERLKAALEFTRVSCDMHLKTLELHETGTRSKIHLHLPHLANLHRPGSHLLNTHSTMATSLVVLVVQLMRLVVLGQAAVVMFAEIE